MEHFKKKYSIIQKNLGIKIFTHFVLYILGFGTILSIYSKDVMYNYGYRANSVRIPAKSYIDTPSFTGKFQKYIERTAEYIKYKENPSVYNNEDLKMFHYYNDKLNSPTNFIYFVKNKTTGKEYYSQYYFKEKKLSTTSQFESVIEHKKVYFVLDTSTKKYTTNLNTDYYFDNSDIDWITKCIAEQLNQNVTDNEPNQFIIYASVDDSFLVNDDFYVAATNYGFYSKFYPMLPICILLLLVFFAFSIAISGHSANKEKIVLLKFDTIKTEFAAFIIASLSFFCIIFTYCIKYKFCNSQLPLTTAIHLAILYFFLYPIPLFGFYSLVRRIKANTIWSNSILRFLSNKGKKILHVFLENKNITYKVSVLFIFFTAINAFAFYLPIPWIFIIISFISYIGAALLLFKISVDLNKIIIHTKEIASGNLDHKIPIENMIFTIKSMGNDINNISCGLSAAIEEQLKSERMKTELITNVSHDIKTPLTSIINYVDLLKKEKLQNEKAVEYLEVIQQKSWRLKILIEDLVEASKASTGTISLHLEKLNLVELIRQSAGEFEDRFLSRKLELILNITEEPIYIIADGRSTFRIIENVFSNTFKYALMGTRVYVNIFTNASIVTVTIKNISSEKLNISSDELMERFVRGDIARNTEGSGLGLSIAKSLATLQKGNFELELDGDLFKAIITFNTI